MARDVYLVDLESGNKDLILKGIRGSVHLSPKAKFVLGFDRIDTTWIAYSVESKKIIPLTKGKVFYD